MTGSELLAYGAALARASAEDRTWPGGYHGAPVEPKPEDFDDLPTRPGHRWPDEEPTSPGFEPARRSLTPSDLPALAYPCPSSECGHYDCEALRSATETEGRVMAVVEPEEEITARLVIKKDRG
jgi:hypothetical protein